MSDTLEHSIVPELDNEQAPSREAGLWVTDAEIIRRLGVSEKTGYAAIHRLEKSGMGFPEKHRTWGKKRYWPAVKAFFDEHYGLNSGGSTTRSRYGKA